MGLRESTPADVWEVFAATEQKHKAEVANLSNTMVSEVNKTSNVNKGNQLNASRCNFLMFPEKVQDDKDNFLTMAEENIWDDRSLYTVWRTG